MTPATVALLTVLTAEDGLLLILVVNWFTVDMIMAGGELVFLYADQLFDFIPIIF
jgi:hypothetical protein